MLAPRELHLHVPKLKSTGLCHSAKVTKEVLRTDRHAACTLNDTDRRRAPETVAVTNDMTDQSFTVSRIGPGKVWPISALTRIECVIYDEIHAPVHAPVNWRGRVLG